MYILPHFAIKPVGLYPGIWYKPIANCPGRYWVVYYSPGLKKRYMSFSTYYWIEVEAFVQGVYKKLQHINGE
jgi:hypothetical protein